MSTNSIGFLRGTSNEYQQHRFSQRGTSNEYQQHRFSQRGTSNEYQQHRFSLGNITKTCLYNFDSLKPLFHMAKLGFTGVYIFLISAQNIDCGYSLEPPHRGGSNEYPQSMF